MKPRDKVVREWVEEIALRLCAEPEQAVDFLLQRAIAAAADGAFPLPGLDAEESRGRNLMLLRRKRVGLQVPAPDGAGDGSFADDAQQRLACALREEGLADKTATEEFTLGVGVGTGAAIIVAAAGLVTILKHAPDAFDNVRRWASALRKAIVGDDYATLNVETLKLICVDEVLRLHPRLKHLDPELIAATVAVGVDPATDEEETLGPVYVIVPVGDAGVTYVFVVNWRGTILHRTSMPFVGAEVESSPEHEMLTDGKGRGDDT